MPNSSRSKRVLIYSHDSFGLGHVQPVPDHRQCHRRGRQVGLGPDHFGLADDRLLEFRSGIDFVRIPGVVKQIDTGDTTRPISGSASSIRSRCVPDHP